MCCPGPAGVVGAFAGLGLVIAGVTYAAYAQKQAAAAAAGLTM
jgi:hypothetical protein